MTGDHDITTKVERQKLWSSLKLMSKHLLGVENAAGGYLKISGTLLLPGNKESLFVRSDLSAKIHDVRLAHSGYEREVTMHDWLRWVDWSKFFDYLAKAKTREDAIRDSGMQMLFLTTAYRSKL